MEIFRTLWLTVVGLAVINANPLPKPDPSPGKYTKDYIEEVIDDVINDVMRKYDEENEDKKEDQTVTEGEVQDIKNEFGKTVEDKSSDDYYEPAVENNEKEQVVPDYVAEIQDNTIEDISNDPNAALDKQEMIMAGQDVKQIVEANQDAESPADEFEKLNEGSMKASEESKDEKENNVVKITKDVMLAMNMEDTIKDKRALSEKITEAIQKALAERFDSKISDDELEKDVNEDYEDQTVTDGKMQDIENELGKTLADGSNDGKKIDEIKEELSYSNEMQDNAIENISNDPNEALDNQKMPMAAKDVMLGMNMEDATNDKRAMSEKITEAIHRALTGRFDSKINEERDDDEDDEDDDENDDDEGITTKRIIKQAILAVKDRMA